MDMNAAKQSYADDFCKAFDDAKWLKNPHQSLGLIEKEGQKFLCAYRKADERVQVQWADKVETLNAVGKGFFLLPVGNDCSRDSYHFLTPSGKFLKDPYNFSPAVSARELQLFKRGVLYQIGDVFGSQCITHEGVKGTRFLVWAPSAKAVYLSLESYGPDNHFPMRFLSRYQVWELFVPGIGKGEPYEYYLMNQKGGIRRKTDPFDHFAEKRPDLRSIVWKVDYEWNDKQWMKERKQVSLNRAINVYEVHLASWMSEGENFTNYREIGEKLSTYCLEMGYTHVEILPVSEHPLDESWGYQVTGYYAVTSRLGTPDDFCFFVDTMHQKGIGVILDWVPAHFPEDDFSFANFDGTELFEHKNPLRGYHPQWTTKIFDYGKPQVSNFLIGSALHYLRHYHIDGLRVDAVSSLLYLDYERKEKEWLPNELGTNVNFEAKAFIRHLNRLIKNDFPGVLLFAEESHAFPEITRPLKGGGIGFDCKWSLGWMHDTLKFLQTDYPYRSHEYKELRRLLSYMYEEKHILVLSHDEVVHEKKSLLRKMPGEQYLQFASLRQLMCFMMTFPGKKLLFMGGEIAQSSEWACKESLPWELLKFPDHASHREFIKNLNHFYLHNSALWEEDFHKKGFKELIVDDEKNCVFAFLRKGQEQELICVHNFQRASLKDYSLPLSTEGDILFHSNEKRFGGDGVNPEIYSHAGKLTLSIPALTSLIIQIRKV